MGIYVRGTSVWFRFKLQGKVERRPSGFKTLPDGSIPKEAEAVFAELEKRLGAGLSVDDVDLGIPTVRSYGARWLKEREDRGVGSVDQERMKLQKWVYPALGMTPLKDLRPKVLQSFVRALQTKLSKKKKPLSARSVRGIWGILSLMLKDAVADELMVATPAVLKRGDLPPLADSDPTWRDGAVFSKGELVLLVTSPKIPLDRRVLYALYLFTGARTNEGSCLRWSDYQAQAKPLGRLVIAKAWDRAKGKTKTTKTKQVRKVPVHPFLADMLKAWRAEGWGVFVGRQPGPDDLIIPSAEGEVRRVTSSLRHLHQDLKRLGLPKRRLYDTRRTFISLALGDGARKDVLQWLTHPPRETFDAYTTLPWETFCEAVACLKVPLGTGPGTPPSTPSGGMVGSSRSS